jgi:hypothetical protein
MLRQRFSFISVTAMIGVTVFAVLAVCRFRGAVGFAAHRGYPFTWYWYTDVSSNDDPGYGYRWSGLVLDIAIWLLAIIAFGLCVEYMLQRFSKKHETKTAS